MRAGQQLAAGTAQAAERPDADYLFPAEVVVDGADPATNFTMHARQAFSAGPVEIPTP